MFTMVLLFYYISSLLKGGICHGHVLSCDYAGCHPACMLDRRSQLVAVVGCQPVCANTLAGGER